MKTLLLWEQVSKLIRRPIPALLWLFFPLAGSGAGATASLVVSVQGLRSTDGVVRVFLHNTDGSIPDPKFRNYYQDKVVPASSDCRVSFGGLPPGTYAVSIHHDENSDGKLNRGLVLPTEGVGYSNFQSIGLSHRPNFKAASFELITDTEKRVTMVYL